MSAKQIQCYNDPAIYKLLSGPRICGKTIEALHECVKKAYSISTNRVGVFVRSARVGKQGVWDTLVNTIIPIWEDDLADEGFKVTVPESQTGDTRMTYLRIANVHGTESEFQLHSIHHDEDYNSKLKSTNFGVMFFDELDVYPSEDLFLISKQQLRLIGSPLKDHLWIATCNPPEEGTDSWIYKKWFVDAISEDMDEDLRKLYAVYQFTLDDNIFADPLQIKALKNDYAKDPEKYDRLVLGKYTASSTNCCFSGAFRRAHHVTGDENNIILPTENCMEIIVAWDIGDINHSISFVEHVITAEGDYWTVFDEIVSIGKDISIEQLTYEAMAKMGKWRMMCKSGMHYKHWSDRSAHDSFKASADATDQLLVRKYSQGQINLIAAPKHPNSIMQRVALLRRLFCEDRVYISFNCPAHMEMALHLKKKAGRKDQIVRDKHCHVFDSLTYGIYGETFMELDMGMRPKAKPMPAFSV